VALVIGCPPLAWSQTTDAGRALETLIHGGQGATSEQPGLSAAFARVIARAVGTFPIASSSSGFVYRFDPTLGIPIRVTRSFGPLMIDRPETSGRGRWSIDFSAQSVGWTSVDGVSLERDGFMTRDGGSLGTVDAVHYSVENVSHAFFSLRTTTALIGVTVGVTDRVDVTVRLPIVQQDVSGRIERTAEWSSLTECPDSNDVEDCGFPITYARSSTTERVRGSSFGPGDVGLRAKMKLLESPDAGLAALAHVTLPTGRERSLLGTGRPAYGIVLIGSAQSGVIGSHATVGYTVAGSGFPRRYESDFAFAAITDRIEPSDELNYAAGFDVVTGPHVTVNADMVGRSLINSAEIAAGWGGIGLRPRRRLPILLGAVGIKAHIASQWLVVTNFLVPLSEGGLKPRVTPVIGFERAF